MRSCIHFFIALATLSTVMVAAMPTNRIKACGHRLTDILTLVCDGRGFNGPMSQTESTTPVPHRRVTRGVADECCKIGCTWSTMEQYCSPGESIISPWSSSRTAREDLAFNHIDPHILDPSMENNRPSQVSRKEKKKHKKKGRRRKCRCRRHRKKFDMNKIDNLLKDQPPIEIGTVPSLNLGKPVFVPRLKRRACH